MTIADIKNFVEIFALVIAGVWAIYGFVVFRQREKAVAELQKLQDENKLATVKTRDISVIRTDLTATSARRPDGPGYCILAEVALVNEGLCDMRIPYQDEHPIFLVQRAAFDPDGTTRFVDPPIRDRVRRAVNPNAEVVSHIVLAGGGTQQLAFAVNVATPGIYFVSFRVPLQPADRSMVINAGAASGNTVSLTATKYIVVADVMGSRSRSSDGEIEPRIASGQSTLLATIDSVTSEKSNRGT
ncbi:MAG: hypothetical protein R3C14_06875 [Caldilineaceae bacterium]